MNTTMESILTDTCQINVVSRETITSTRREHVGCSDARSMFAGRCRELGYPFAMIGDALNNGASAVRYMVKRHRDMIDVDTNYRMRWAELAKGVTCQE